MPAWTVKTILLGVVLGLCKVDAYAVPGSQSPEAGHRGVVRLQMENDRLSGTDDGHTYSLRLFVEWPARRPATTISIGYESLVRRSENSRVDLLGIDSQFAYPIGTGGRFAFSGGVAINGDLGGQSLQNTFHNWLNESTLSLAYPDAYAFGLTAGARIDQKLTDIGRFRVTGSGDIKVASNAAPSSVQGGIYMGRKFIPSQRTNLEIQFGVSLNNFFWLDGILKPYYDAGYSLDSELRFEWRRLSINLFFYSNPYGIDQGILGVGFGGFF